MSESPQAFPAAYAVGPADDLYPPAPGMSLRDWFAGQALAGAMAHHGSYGACNGPGEIAARAYALADALLSERVKGEEK